MYYSQKRVVANPCEDLVKVIVNSINFSCVSNSKSSDPHKRRFSKFIFEIFLSKLEIKLKVPLRSFDLSLV